MKFSLKYLTLQIKTRCAKFIITYILFSGAYMVLSYPHFLYADTRYRNGVLGLNPIEEDHRIFLDLEPNTGTVMRGAKRAQFNVFMRNINGIPITGNLLTTLTPIIWIEEGFALPDEYADILTTQVVQTLGLVNVLVPVLVAISCAILVLGIIIFLCAKKKDVV
uniref:Sensory neuron membrane protein 2 n=1 Tax=Leucinodes orbonalis TaxID=711050 RepID=A0AA49X7N4_9NEOP|nr:sensory neuron membrane protein [Leucinodes orbonalis]